MVMCLLNGDCSEVFGQNSYHPDVLKLKAWAMVNYHDFELNIHITVLKIDQVCFGRLFLACGLAWSRGGGL